MSYYPVFAQTFRSLARTEACNFCRHRNAPTIRRYAASVHKLQKPAYRDARRKPTQGPRIENDRRIRIGFFTLIKQEGLIFLDPTKADQLIVEFQASEENGVDPATNVQRLAKKYKVLVGDITYLAIPLLRVPDIKDPNVQLPPSQNPTIAARLLLACSAAKDVMATVQILNAVHLSKSNGIPQAQDIARLFSATEINTCKAMLEELAAKGDSYALTLQGQFLEQAGQREQASRLYEQALEKCNFKFDPAYPHPMALPIINPWMALSSLTLSDRPEDRAKAKPALEQGALKGGDPLAYYQLAALEDGPTPDWLHYTSKAAASGHYEAMYKLGQFYKDVNSDPFAFSKDSRFTKALKFLTSWKPSGLQKFAKQWFEVAAAGGHKPAMLGLVELYDTEGDRSKSAYYLQQMTEPPQAGKAEQWPRLVEEAKKRLLKLSTASRAA